MTHQSTIIQALHVQAPFLSEADLVQEVMRRKTFIKNTLRQSGLKNLVLGISGGVDSTLAGRLAQLAVAELRQETDDVAYQFIAVRLPYKQQQDEVDATLAMQFIAADVPLVVNIFDTVQGLTQHLPSLDYLTPSQRDFTLGNVKARARMLAQFTLANIHQGLVIGTDHAAEAVMGFFTKFGDGACDLAPLTGLVKGQVRQMAAHLGAPTALVYKTPTADLEELAPCKPDEEAHGVPYDVIDAFLQGQIVDARLAAIIIQRYESSQHKRDLPLTPVGFEAYGH